MGRTLFVQRVQRVLCKYRFTYAVLIIFNHEKLKKATKEMVRLLLETLNRRLRDTKTSSQQNSSRNGS